MEAVGLDSVMPGVGLLLLGLIVLLLYFLPSIVAIRRQMRSALGVMVVNFFLGWTLIGSVVALAWAVSGDT